MPQYDQDAASVDKPVLTAGIPVVLWEDEQPLATSPANTASRQVCLHRDSHAPNCVSLEIKFAGDPGNFQIDVETADTDEEEYYVTRQSIIESVSEQVLNDSFVCRVEMSNVVAKFLRLNMVDCDNAVEVTAKAF